MNIQDLKKPFDPKRISWRVGSMNADKTKGMALAYLDSRDVQDRLDEVCGPENWQCRYQLLGKTTVCEIGILLPQPAGEGKIHDWVWKADGAGESDIEAEKGAMSDSFKRSAVKWGVGRYLYDLDSPWVEIEPAGRSFKIKKSEMAKLHSLLGHVVQDHKAEVDAENAPVDARRMAGMVAAKKGTQALTDWGNTLSVKERHDMDTYIRLTLWKVATLADKNSKVA